MLVPYSNNADSSAVQCQSTLFLILGIPSVIATFFSQDKSVMALDLFGGILLTAIGILGLVATKNSKYASWFLTGLHIYGVILSVVYAMGLFGLLLLTIDFPTCGPHSSGTCKSQQGYAIAFMVFFMFFDLVLFGLLILVTYAIRDGRRLLP